MTTGDCFINALAGCEIMARDVPGVRLVHGIPTGTGGGIEGVRFWHAWVEVVIDGIPTVIDYSNGRDVVMARDDYYRLGQIEQVFRYKPVQAAREKVKAGTYGPWVKGWETMTDEPDRNLVQP